jgi:hypothetical protein
MPLSLVLRAAVLALAAAAPPRAEPAAPPLRSGASTAAPARLAPATPPGMPPCTKPLAPVVDLPRAAGETIRYVVDVDGLSVGTIDFRVERNGTLGGRAVTEYRSVFKIDKLVGALIPGEGRAASVVPVGTFWPAQAMIRLTQNKDQIETDSTFGDGGKTARSRKTRNGKPTEESRAFPGPAQDFVTAFYVARSLATNADGCGIIYSNQRAYTIWLKPDGDEQVMTPVGLKPAHRYSMSWASEKSKGFAEARYWVSTGPDRLPYKAELFGPNHVEARVQLYEMGGS